MQIYDEGANIAETYDVHSFPHYFLLSKDGIILQKMDGWANGREAEILKAIEKALKE